MIEKIKRLFNEHPTDVGETYLQHMFQALAVACRLIITGLSQLVHAFLPFCDPPFGTDIGSTIMYLQEKKPESRKSGNAGSKPQ